MTTLDRDVCYRALLARDPRFDGRIFVGVVTTVLPQLEHDFLIAG